MTTCTGTMTCPADAFAPSGKRTCTYCHGAGHVDASDPEVVLRRTGMSTRKNPEVSPGEACKHAVGQPAPYGLTPLGSAGERRPAIETLYLSWRAHDYDAIADHQATVLIGEPERFLDIAKALRVLHPDLIDVALFRDGAFVCSWQWDSDVWDT